MKTQLLHGGDQIVYRGARLIVAHDGLPRREVHGCAGNARYAGQFFRQALNTSLATHAVDRQFYAGVHSLSMRTRAAGFAHV